MVWKDYDRAWKGYQKEFFQTQLAMVKDEKRAVENEISDMEEELKPAPGARPGRSGVRCSATRSTRRRSSAKRSSKLEVAAADKAMKGAKGLLRSGPLSVREGARGVPLP